METNTTNGVSAIKRHPLFKWILVVSIAIVANLFLNYALDAFYQRPQFESFCPVKQVNNPILTEKACLTAGGQWNSDPYRYAGTPKPVPVDAPLGYCNETFTC